MNRKIAYFRELVFVSSCAVALRVYDDKDHVYDVMRDFRGSNAQSKHLSKLVCGAKWANRAMSLLSQNKWASRSWNVIFAGKSIVLLGSSHQLTMGSRAPNQLLRSVRRVSYRD